MARLVRLLFPINLDLRLKKNPVCYDAADLPKREIVGLTRNLKLLLKSFVLLAAAFGSLSSCFTPTKLLERSPNADPNTQLIRRDRYIHNLHGLWLGHVLGTAMVRRQKKPAATGSFRVAVETPWRASDRQLKIHRALEQWEVQDLIDLGDRILPGEFFGALNPGLPSQVKEDYGLWKLTTGSSQETHRELVLAMLFSIAPSAPSYLDGGDQLLWIVDKARSLMPPQSELDPLLAELVAGFQTACLSKQIRGCLTWQQAATKLSEGERFKAASKEVRDLLAVVFAILYGEGGLLKTLEVSAFVGWGEVDVMGAPTALLGLLHGENWIYQQFGGRKISDYVDLPGQERQDQIPADFAAEDSMLLISIRMMNSVEKFVLRGGGKVLGAEFLIPMRAQPLSN